MVMNCLLTPLAPGRTAAARFDIPPGRRRAGARRAVRVAPSRAERMPLPGPCRDLRTVAGDNLYLLHHRCCLLGLGNGCCPPFRQGRYHPWPACCCAKRHLDASPCRRGGGRCRSTGEAERLGGVKRTSASNIHDRPTTWSAEGANFQTYNVLPIFTTAGATA